MTLPMQVRETQLKLAWNKKRKEERLFVELKAHRDSGIAGSSGSRSSEDLLSLYVWVSLSSRLLPCDGPSAASSWHIQEKDMLFHCSDKDPEVASFHSLLAGFQKQSIPKSPVVSFLLQPRSRPNSRGGKMPKLHRKTSMWAWISQWAISGKDGPRVTGLHIPAGEALHNASAGLSVRLGLCCSTFLIYPPSKKPIPH